MSSTMRSTTAAAARRLQVLQATGCTDLRIPSTGDAWHDGRGQDCAWYATDMRCTTTFQSGGREGWMMREGLDARRACCVCGGGVTCSAECSAFFVGGCHPLRINTHPGNPYAHCRAELDQQHSTWLNRNLTTRTWNGPCVGQQGCIDTDAMAALRPPPGSPNQACGSRHISSECREHGVYDNDCCGRPEMLSCNHGYAWSQGRVGCGYTHGWCSDCVESCCAAVSTTPPSATGWSTINVIIRAEVS
eukprot:gene51988-biopygen105725